MRIVMRKTVTVSPNGTDVATFEAGKDYELNGERGEDLAALLLRDKVAVEFRAAKTSVPASGTKNASPKAVDDKGGESDKQNSGAKDADSKTVDDKGAASDEKDGA